MGDWRLVSDWAVVRQRQSRARVDRVGAPIEIDGQVGRCSAGGACSRGRRVGEGAGLSLQARRDARRGKRVSTNEGGRGKAGDGGCRKGEGGIDVFFSGGQHQVLRLVLPGRLAGNPPFLLGRRGEGELPVQLEECRLDRCEGVQKRADEEGSPAQARKGASGPTMAKTDSTMGRTAEF
ncbi:hypothetical protein VTK56DRAFT_6862 [Thermocarpiscus australiensis]